MKILDDVDLSSSSILKRQRVQKKFEHAKKLVDCFWDAFVGLIGTEKGKVLDLTDEPSEGLAGESHKWKNNSEWNVMGARDRSVYRGKIINRHRHLFNEIFRRAKGVPGGVKNRPSLSYIGDGKIVLYWRYLAPKRVNGKS